MGIAYSQSFSASGGSGNYTYALSGDMPAGLSPDPVTGILSGRPTVPSSFTFTITATDTDTVDPANTASANYTLVIAAGGLSLSPAVPGATFGQPYAHTLSATGGTAPYTFTLLHGALPAGLSLGPDGLISGTPREEGMLHFVVFAQDSTGGTPINGSRTYSMSVAPPTITLTPASLPNAQVGAAYSMLITASGGTAPYTYSATGLPPGLTLAADGRLSGTSHAVGIANFAVTAKDANDATGSAAYSLTVIDAVAPTVLSTAVAGSPGPDATSVTFEVVFSEPVTGFSTSDLALTTTGSATGTISGLSTDDNITYRASVTAISGIGSLRLDVGAGGSISDGSGNSLAAAFTSGAAWTRGGSTNAQLSGLAPSTGALSPAFSAGTRAYMLAVPNSVETFALTPTAADPSATITVSGQTVASGTASPAITLNIGTTAIVVVVTAPDGSTTQTYTVTVDRPAPTVIDLTPAAGALPGATMGADYSQTLAASGGASPYSYAVTAGALPAGLTLAADGTLRGSPTAAGAASFTVTATDANGAAGSAAYTLDIRTAPASSNADLAGLLPGSGSLQPGFNAGMLDYAVSVGNEVETIAVTPTAADANASITVNSQPVASGTVSRPIALSVGSNPVQIVVTAEDGTTTRAYTVTVTRAVITRPDPSQDPEVIGLLNARADTARRFAQDQIINFQRRLEQLHDEGERRASSMDLHLGLNPSNTAAQQIDQMIASSHGAALNARASQPGAAASMPGVLAYSPDGTLPAASGTEGLGASPDSSFAGPDLGRLAIWSGGFVNFGARDNGGSDLDHTMVGVSGGLDYRFSQQLIGGFGVGYGRDRTDIGQNGTASGADAYSVAIYGSYKPIDNLFIDALIGGSWMDFDSTRYATANGDFATGSRDGTQLFGALTAAYEFGDEVWLISPYGRVAFSRSWLDGFSETGGGSDGLTYGEQTIDSLSGVLGIRANYAFQMDWGTLMPGVRAEYTYDFEGSSQASLGYTDSGGTPYSINLDPTARDHLTLGLSLDFQFDSDWNLGLDYRTSIGGSNNQDHALGAKLGVRF
ncbi:autotransporter domain-containing protein (plasmid) [Devosia sp. A8/3-2]|nr:autotransporter domain-containing protein [Devosia sp. A8/3-2]